MTINEEIEDQDRKLCWIYGMQSREFFPDASWTDIELVLQTGWTRIRRDSSIDWRQARPHVRAGWEDASPLGEPRTNAAGRLGGSTRSADGI